MHQRFLPFIEQLQRELAEPLPGKDAQYRMAPRPRPGGERSDQPTTDARRGAVLMLFYPHNAELYIPLILRPTYNGVHSGQIGFPGGGYESIDGTLRATALREAYEEVGVRPAWVRTLGQLSPLYINASNYLVQPWVGWVTTRPDFRLDPYEVESLIEAPLSALQDTRNHFVEEWELRDRRVHVPFFRIQEHIIWGATAMMLSELLSLPALRQLSQKPL